MTKEELEKDPEMMEIYNNMKDDRVGGRQSISKTEGDERFEDPLAYKFDVGELFGDLVMAEYIDESEDAVEVNGIYIPTAMSARRHNWRTAVVRKLAPDAPKSLKPGDIIRFHDDKGIPMMEGSHKYIFLNAARIFCTMIPREAPREKAAKANNGK
jgi:hypothetical protein